MELASVRVALGVDRRTASSTGRPERTRKPVSTGPEAARLRVRNFGIRPCASLSEADTPGASWTLSRPNSSSSQYFRSADDFSNGTMKATVYDVVPDTFSSSDLSEYASPSSLHIIHPGCTPSASLCPPVTADTHPVCQLASAPSLPGSKYISTSFNSPASSNKLCRGLSLSHARSSSNWTTPSLLKSMASSKACTRLSSQ
mmetsp:Transcript_47800/g.133275  ORF Transcript_47800/g.133275 Transcript_47800/m.133275 type:complete len:201 (-) Transcript_47800:170-772(-)